MDCSSPNSSVHEIFQGILEWVAFPPPGALPNPGMESTSPALAGGFITTEPPGKPSAVHICVITKIQSNSLCLVLHVLYVEYFTSLNL